MKYHYLLFVIAFLPMITYGQSGYISTDSIVSVGIKLKDGGEIENARICNVKERGGGIVEYSPFEIKEYGLGDGRIYISREIQIAGSPLRVFLQRLHKGNSSLYYYRAKGVRTFFLEKDSSLFVEISRRNQEGEKYQEQIAEYLSDCPQVSVAAKHVQYNKRSLNELITRYNQCELKPFPHFRYGLTFGTEFTQLNPSNDFSNENWRPFDYNYESGFIFGFFIDNPILVSHFSFHAEAYYSKSSFSFNKLIDNRDLDFVANFSSIKIPLLLRYSYPSNRLRPFVNLGLVGSYNYKNETLFYQSSFSQGTIELSDVEDSSLIAETQMGYGVGAGMEYPLNYKHSLFLEVRLSKQYGLFKPETFNISNFNLTTGISF